MTLAERSCQPCRGDANNTDDISVADRNALMAELPHWSMVTENGVEHLSRCFSFADYRHAVDFTLRVAELAEAEDHHPRLVLEWGRVTVDWWTHTRGGVHINDFILAARCDRLV